MAVRDIGEYRAQRSAPAPVLDRLPPHNVDAEQAVIGALLIDADALTVASEVVQPADFFRDAHRFVFEAMLGLRSRGEPLDVVTVVDELDHKTLLPAVGGVAYVHSLATVVPTAIHVAHYASIVRETAQKRRLIGAAGRIAALGYDGDTTSATGISEAAGLLRDLVDERVRRGGHISTITLPEELRLEPMATPFAGLNEALNGGLRPGVSYVVAAPPGGLKTSLLIDVARAALEGCYGVLYVTNELPAYIVRERFLANMGRYHLGRALRGQLWTDEVGRREDAEAVLNQMPLYLYESVPTVEEIGLRLASAKARQPEVKGWLLVLDYIQRLDDDPKLDRHRLISRAFGQLQTLSRNEKTALLVASSLAMGDWQKEPTEWGGRESGDIRGYTSVFFGLQRHKDEDYRDQDGWMLAVRGWLVKNTLGMETQIDYTVHGPSQRWTEAAKA